jgi:dienelactone hydrolase
MLAVDGTNELLKMNSPPILDGDDHPGFPSAPVIFESMRNRGVRPTASSSLPTWRRARLVVSIVVVALSQLGPPQSSLFLADSFALRPPPQQRRITTIPPLPTRRTSHGVSLKMIVQPTESESSSSSSTTTGRKQEPTPSTLRGDNDNRYRGGNDGHHPFDDDDEDAGRSIDPGSSPPNDDDDPSLSFGGGVAPTTTPLPAAVHDDDDDGYDYDEPPPRESELRGLTVPQLKQQLRLRGLKVSGTKQELADRLLLHVGGGGGGGPRAVASVDDGTPSTGASETTPSSVLPDVSILNEGVAKKMKDRRSKARKQAQERGGGKEYIDVTAYLDDDDRGKDFKSSLPREISQGGNDGDGDAGGDDDGNKSAGNPEVWGTDAKIVTDYEGRSPVVDGLSRTVVEFKGSNRTTVQAFVVASRDAMKPFLEGGRNRTITNAADPDSRLREIQLKRETAERQPVRFEDDEGLDEGDEVGNYKDILHRDYSDWGKYSVTGAQLSAQEVQGVLMLTDVYGPFTEETKALAEKIAFECQPVVCMVPDLFRGRPWKEDVTTPGFNEEGQDYEEWRADHPDLRVSIDIRAAAAVLRQQYGVSSIAVWGTSYGGGRALEVAAGYLPDGQIHDVNGAIGPPTVEPEVAVAWYPTRYNAKQLFGSGRSSILDLPSDRKREFAVMGIFAGKDKYAGATKQDAAELKALLAGDERVKDYIVKVFPDLDHGFAHNAIGRNHDESEVDRFVDDEFGGAGRVSIDDGDAEVACLLSTAFMETYSRKYLPTTGLPVSKDESAVEWNEELNMKNFRNGARRDVRQEIEESLENFVEEPLNTGRMFDPGDESQRDELLEALRAMQPEGVPDELKILDDDNLETVYAKLMAADDKFELF